MYGDRHDADLRAFVYLSATLGLNQSLASRTLFPTPAPPVSKLKSIDLALGVVAVLAEGSFFVVERTQ